MAQTAAVLGVGLLYQGTAHRLMTEFLLGAWRGVGMFIFWGVWGGVA